MRCGDRYAPARRPWRARIAAIIRVVEDLPLVPTTWIDSKRRSGCPSTSSGGACGPGRSASRTARAQSTAGARPRLRGSQRLQLGPPARASFSRSASTTAARRLGDEARVGELALGALDLGSSSARALRAARSAAASRPPSPGGSPRRPRDRDRGDRLRRPCRRRPRTRPGPAARAARRLLVAVRPRAAPARRRRLARSAPSRQPRTPGWPRSRARAPPRPPDRCAAGLRAAAARRPAAPPRPGYGSRSPRSRTGSPDAPARRSRCSTCSSVAAVVRVAVVQARLDELQVPVAQLAVDEVVEAERRVGEVEALDPVGDLRPARAEAREDPAVLDRGRLRRRRARPPVARSRISARRSTACW